MPEPTPFRWRNVTPVQRRVLIAAALGWMLDSFDVLLYSIVLATLMQHFGMNKTMAGLLNALTLIASAAGGLVFGFLADRTGRRRLLCVSILVYAVFTFACGFANSIAVLAIFRFLLGLGMGGEWNTGAALLAESWPSAWRGRAFGIVQSSWAIGYALSAVAAGVILTHFSWRWVFFAGILPALAVFWIRRHVPEPELWRRAQAESAANDAGDDWRRIAPSLIVLTLVNTFGMFAWWGLFTWIPAYLVLPASEGGRSFTLFNLTGFLVVLNLAGMLPGYQLFGVFADKFGRRLTLVIYLLAAAAAVPFFARSHRPALILLFACICAFFGTGFFTGSGTIGSELFPTRIRATALGISYNVARGLSALAPLTIGYLAQQRGLSWAFGASAVAFAAAGLTGLFLPETRGAELA
jgi:MFS family permease